MVDQNRDLKPPQRRAFIKDRPLEPSIWFRPLFPRCFFFKGNRYFPTGVFFIFPGDQKKANGSQEQVVIFGAPALGSRTPRFVRRRSRPRRSWCSMRPRPLSRRRRWRRSRDQTKASALFSFFVFFFVSLVFLFYQTKASALFSLSFSVFFWF